MRVEWKEMGLRLAAVHPAPHINPLLNSPSHNTRVSCYGVHLCLCTDSCTVYGSGQLHPTPTTWRSLKLDMATWGVNDMTGT